MRNCFLALVTWVAIAAPAAADPSTPDGAKSASGKAKRLSFKLTGRHDARGRFTSRLRITTAKSPTVTRTVRYADGGQATLVGTGTWRANQLVATLRSPRTPGLSGSLLVPLQGVQPPAKPHTLFRLVVDAESGFCVERCLDARGASRALGRLQTRSQDLNKPALVLPQPKLADLAGWAIKVPGTVHHAARHKDQVYVAAGAAGLQVVDLDREAVKTSIKLPGHAHHVAISGDVAFVTATLRGKTFVHRVDLTRARLLGSFASKRAVGATALPKQDRLAVLGRDGAIRFLDSQGKLQGTARTTRVGSTAPGVDLAKGTLFLPLGGGGGLGLIDVAQRKTLEMISTRDVLHDVRVIGRRAFVAGSFHGLGVIDLDKRTYCALGLRDVRHLFASKDRIYALTADALVELSATGKVLGRTELGVTLPAAPAGEQWIVDVRDGSAVLALRGLGIVILEL